MNAREYKTRRGALLAQLEHRRIAPGHWVVEGHEVIQHDDRGLWRVNGKHGENALGVFSTFTEGLEAIAERLSR